MRASANRRWSLERIDLRPLREDGAPGSLPLVESAGGSVEEWVAGHPAELAELLGQQHAVLLRGFETLEAEALARIASLIGGQPLDYRSGVAPRGKMAEGVYTSTELDQGLTLPPHNELSYAARWPRWILFTCLQPAQVGGQTPLSDVRCVLAALEPQVRARFEEQGVTYVRNYGVEASSVNVSWMQSFETRDPKAVEGFCRASNIDFEWREGDTLRTRRKTPAIRKHPVTSELLWFNQANAFHSSSLDRRVRRGMLIRFGPEGLPMNALFGNGDQIPTETMMEVHRAYDQNTLLFDWQRGDLLILDNMIFAHGRLPFEGERRVLVAMAAMFDPDAGSSDRQTRTEGEN